MQLKTVPDQVALLVLLAEGGGLHDLVRQQEGVQLQVSQVTHLQAGRITGNWRHVHCTLYTVYCTLYTVQGTVDTVQCTLYSIHCTVE